MTKPDSQPDPLPESIETGPGGVGNRIQTLTRDPKIRSVIAMLILTIVAFSLCLLAVNRAPRLSAYDEATHIDYAWSLAHFELPVTGAPLSGATLHSWACRGQANIPTLPSCGSSLKPSDFPASGEQYNGFHPPIYYTVTGLVSRLAALTGKDFVTVARSLGAIWLSAAMVSLFFTLRYWMIGWRLAFLGALFLPLVPSVLFASSTVTNDAAAPLAGVAGLFVLGRVLIHQNTDWAIPTVMALLAASTKILNALALLAVASILIILALMRWRQLGFESSRPLMRIGFMIAAAVGVVYISWGIVSNYHTVSNWSNSITNLNRESISGSPIDEWLPTLVSGFKLGSDPYLDPMLASGLLAAWIVASSLLLNSGPFIGVALFTRGTARWLLAVTLIMGCLIYPLLVQIQVLIASRNYAPEIPPRYGMSLIPVAIAVLATIAEKNGLRTTGIMIIGVGILSVLLTISGTLV